MNRIWKVLLAGLTAGTLVGAITLAAAGPAAASCIYNLGDNVASDIGEPATSVIAVGFSSTGTGVEGYSSEYLPPGSSQCWNDHGWAGGFVTNSGWGGDLAVAQFFNGLTIDAGEWIVVGAVNDPAAQRNDLCSGPFVPAGWAQYNVNNGPWFASQTDTAFDCASVVPGEE